MSKNILNICKFWVGVKINSFLKKKKNNNLVCKFLHAFSHSTTGLFAVSSHGNTKTSGTDQSALRPKWFQNHFRTVTNLKNYREYAYMFKCFQTETRWTVCSHGFSFTLGISQQHKHSKHSKKKVQNVHGNKQINIKSILWSLTFDVHPQKFRPY